MKLYATYLSSAEKTAEHAAAHALLALAVQEQYQMPLPEIQTGAHGKPFFPAYPELHFNLSHCQGLAVCGLDSHPLGIDAEPIRALRPGVLRLFAGRADAGRSGSVPGRGFFPALDKKREPGKGAGHRHFLSAAHCVLSGSPAGERLRHCALAFFPVCSPGPLDFVLLRPGTRPFPGYHFISDNIKADPIAFSGDTVCFFISFL